MVGIDGVESMLARYAFEIPWKIFDRKGVVDASLVEWHKHRNKILSVEYRAESRHLPADDIFPVVFRRKHLGLAEERGISAAQTFGLKLPGRNGCSGFGKIGIQIAGCLRRLFFDAALHASAHGVDVLVVADGFGFGLALALEGETDQSVH